MSASSHVCVFGLIVQRNAELNNERELFKGDEEEQDINSSVYAHLYVGGLIECT